MGGPAGNQTGNRQPACALDSKAPAVESIEEEDTRRTLPCKNAVADAKQLRMLACQCHWRLCQLRVSPLAYIQQTLGRRACMTASLALRLPTCVTFSSQCSVYRQQSTSAA